LASQPAGFSDTAAERQSSNLSSRSRADKFQVYARVLKKEKAVCRRQKAEGRERKAVCRRQKAANSSLSAYCFLPSAFYLFRRRHSLLPTRWLLRSPAAPCVR